MLSNVRMLSVFKNSCKSLKSAFVIFNVIYDSLIPDSTTNTADPDPTGGDPISRGCYP